MAKNSCEFEATNAYIKKRNHGLQVIAELVSATGITDINDVILKDPGYIRALKERIQERMGPIEKPTIPDGLLKWLNLIDEAHQALFESMAEGQIPKEDKAALTFAFRHAGIIQRAFDVVTDLVLAVENDPQFKQLSNNDSLTDYLHANRERRKQLGLRY
jgi:hypothetical protein